MMNFGRHVFGAASLLLGVAGIALHDQLTSNWTWPGETIFLYVASAAQIIGGVCIQFAKTSQLGAAVLGGVYAIFTLTFVPDVFKQPGAYYTWGDLFYRLASVSGAAIAYVIASPSTLRAKRTCRAAIVLLGLCNVSFAIEQLEYIARTSSLVPKWVPPSGMFWTIATTIAFALAGIAMMSGLKALLASRLTALMMVLFVITIWIPILIADPKTHSNWSEGLETLLIAADAWIAADYLMREHRRGFSEVGVS